MWLSQLRFATHADITPSLSECSPVFHHPPVWSAALRARPRRPAAARDVQQEDSLHHQAIQPAAAVDSFSIRESIRRRSPLQRFIKRARPRWLHFLRFPCERMKKKKIRWRLFPPSLSALFVRLAPQLPNKERWHLEMSARVGGLTFKPPPP